MRRWILVLAACKSGDAPEHHEPPPPPPAVTAVAVPAPPAIATPPGEIISAFVAASRRNEDRSAWLAPRVTLTAQCQTKQLETAYAWVWLDGAHVTWPAQRTCEASCCNFVATDADGPPALDGVAQRICVTAGRISELRMRCD